MSEQQHDWLSALADDESDAQERDFALRRLAGDASMKRRWERYHLMGEALRDNLPPALDDGFAAGVMARVDAEPAQAETARGPEAQRFGFLKPLAGLAVAASVATVAVFSYQYVRSPQQGPAVAQAPASGEFQRLPQTATTVAEREVDERLHHYLVRHSQGASAAQGMIPYGRIVSFDSPAERR